MCTPLEYIYIYIVTKLMYPNLQESHKPNFTGRYTGKTTGLVFFVIKLFFTFQDTGCVKVYL